MGGEKALVTHVGMLYGERGEGVHTRQKANRRGATERAIERRRGMGLGWLKKKERKKRKRARLDNCTIVL